MKTELLTTPIPHELPAYETTVRVSQCENRFEIIAKPGAQLDSWRLQALLANWIQSRMDSENPGGHNPPNSIL